MIIDAFEEAGFGDIISGNVSEVYCTTTGP